MIKRYWKFYLYNLMKSGIFFGHIINKCDKKMHPFIYAKHKGIHIINIALTVRFLEEACNLVFDAASNGNDFLFVGTSTRSSSLVKLAANKSRCHYVNKKWLRGILTNWDTTEKLIYKLRYLKEEKYMGDSCFFNSIKNKNTLKKKQLLSMFNKNLHGIKYMTKLPDIIILVDHKKDLNIFQECILLKIPTICLIDTNSDPYITDFFIPSNNDAIYSIRFILLKLASSICGGRSIYNFKIINKSLN
uniref:Small ribosomal subunit protein uS2c n=1 Tax=Epipogium roseum TaxID=556037 RepID=A0A0B4N4Z4_9ASPA|nr:ribosomal protein S2 [Epipogium roseum]AII40855.1 ribosomal protein S2 [Epipogium roseum]